MLWVILTGVIGMVHAKVIKDGGLTTSLSQTP
ncbi:hypothetical protein Goklo_028170 [Gossypium klotzschianum]|uniref:Uncharacterized protein n=1 Tax=Gossypium klotzschianum TaxID=34286 RepID=A0A7J8U0B1_9ROSI|nr:hypothetical protein [Gossypium klotzschianum]